MGIIRLRAERKKPDRTRLKIAVALDSDGNWVACGGSGWSESDTTDEVLGELLDEITGDAKQQFWLVVELPAPATEVHAGVANDDA